jgi:hypothetical protein
MSGVVAGAYLLLSTTVGVPIWDRTAPVPEEHSVVMSSKQTCDKLRDAMFPSPDNRTDTTSSGWVKYKNPNVGSDVIFAFKTIICTPQ